MSASRRGAQIENPFENCFSGCDREVFDEFGTWTHRRHRCWGRLFPKAKVIHIKFSLECRRQWRLNWQGFTPVVPFFGRFVFGASLEMRGRSRKKSKNDRTIYEFDTRTLNLFLKHVSKSLHHISLFFTVEGKRNCDLWVAGALPDALCRISCLKFAVICCVIKMRLVKQQTT